MTLKQIMSENKGSIALVHSFILLENISWIIEPTFFGQLLDAMIDKFYDKEKINIMFPMAIWIFIYLLNALGGTLGRFFSGKVYSRMYSDVATNLIAYSRKKHHPVSKTLGRAELAKEYMTFLKDRLPEVTWQLCASFGAIVALIFYDWRIALVCFTVIFPMVLINNIYRKNVVHLQKDIHDNREDLYSVVEEKNMEKIHEYYHSMVIPQTRIAKWNSLDYGIVKVLLMIIFIVVLFICVDVDRFTTGKIYAVVAYIWTFIASTEYLPGLMESFTSVKELSTRLREESD